MKKTIALLASLDTKSTEILFMRELIIRHGHSCLIIDIGTRKPDSVEPDITSGSVARAGGVDCEYLIDSGLQKHEMIDVLSKGIKPVLKALLAESRIDGVMSIGGLQNTTVAVSGMMELPLGFPKLMVSTVISGKRRFETVVGSRDIIAFPSIADFTGRNRLSDAILSNAVAAMAGMVEKAGNAVPESEALVIGATLMGVVDAGVSKAVELVKESGFEVISFHSTGVGGRIMDELIRSGMINAVMDFSLHEIVGEIYGGYSSGACDRLKAAGEIGIPQIIAPGALDFLDYESDGLPFPLEGRRYLNHNSKLFHIKATPAEAEVLGLEVGRRINAAKGKVTVLWPTRGLRQATGPGEALYDPAVDRVIGDAIMRGLRPDIRLVEVDANINDLKFSETAAAETIRLLSEAEPREIKNVETAER